MAMRKLSANDPLLKKLGDEIQAGLFARNKQGFYKDSSGASADWILSDGTEIYEVAFPTETGLVSEYFVKENERTCNNR